MSNVIFRFLENGKEHCLQGNLEVVKCFEPEPDAIAKAVRRDLLGLEKETCKTEYGMAVLACGEWVHVERTAMEKSWRSTAVFRSRGEIANAFGV